MGDPLCRYAWQDAALTLADLGWDKRRIEDALNLQTGEVTLLVSAWREDLEVIEAKFHEMRARAAEASRIHGEPLASYERAADTEFLASLPKWTGRKPPVALLRKLGLAK